jgi:membrane fusion protein (multidrug efflux system)
LAPLCACSNGGEAKGRDRAPPLVKVEPASTMRFAERIEAVGTALANEQVTLSANVTERIMRLNFDDGAFVRSGQVVAVLAQGQETAQLNEAQARAREASRQLERVETLKQRGFATNANLDQQVAAAASARAQAAEKRSRRGRRPIRTSLSGAVSPPSIR